MNQQFSLTLDVDTLGEVAPKDQEKILVDMPDLRIEVLDQESGHGFGLAELVTISISIGSGVASDVAASYVRSGIQAVIRRVKGARGETDGTQSAIAELIDRERQSGEHGE